jgi:hypothetical protein
MLPVPADETEGQSSALSDCGVGQIAPVVRGKANYSDDTSGSDQLSEAREAGLRVQVMQGGHGKYGVELAGRQRSIEQIAMDPLDGKPGMAVPGPIKHTGIGIESDDSGHTGLGQLRAENAVSAADIEDARGSLRNGMEKQWVVVDVRVPQLLRGHVEKA